MQKNNDTRIEWLETTRGFACLLILLLHTASPYLYLYEKIPNLSWNTANIVDSFTRMGVPIFFAISGAIFLRGKTPKYRNFKKLILSLVVFSLISLLYTYLRGWPSTWELLINSISKPVFYHLWFFYTIIPLYILMSIIDIKKSNGMYIIILCFIIFTIFNPQIGPFFFSGGKTSSRFMVDGEFLYYILYGVCGAAIAEVTYISEKRKTYTILGSIIILIISVLIISYNTKYMTGINGKFTAPLYNYTSIPVFLSTLSALIILKNVDINNNVKKVLHLVAKNSLEIYGIHAIILDVLLRKNLRMFNYPFIDLPITFLIVLSLSYIFALLVRKPFKRIGM